MSETFDNPHTYRVMGISFGALAAFVVVNRIGEKVEPIQYYETQDAADDAIGKLIAADDDDKHAHRGRHWRGRE